MGHWTEIEPSEGPGLRLAAVGTSDSVATAELVTACLTEAGIAGDCVPIDIPLPEFRDCTQHLREVGFRGVLASGGHRVEAAMLAERYSVSRLSMGVANVLSFRGGIFAQNTEVTALSHLLQPIPAGKALVLGSGAGARSVTAALFEGGWSVRVWNRSPTKLRPLRTLFARYGNVELVYAPDPTDCKLIVNCTPLGAKAGECPPLEWKHVRPKTVFLDFVARRVATEFLRTARSRGLQGIDGRQIVVETMATSLEWLFGGTLPRTNMLGTVGLKGD